MRKGGASTDVKIKLFLLVLIVASVIALTIFSPKISINKTGSSTEKTDTEFGTEAPKELQEGIDALKNLLGIDQILIKEIVFSDNLQIPARIIFGIKSDDTISLGMFLGLSVVWIIFLIILLKITRLVPMLDGIKSWAVAIIIQLLISTTGGFIIVVNTFYSIINSLEKINTIKGGEAIKIAFIIVLAFIIGLMILSLIKYYRKEMELAEAHDEALEEEANKGFLKKIGRMFGMKEE